MDDVGDDRSGVGVPDRVARPGVPLNWALACQFVRKSFWEVWIHNSSELPKPSARVAHATASAHIRQLAAENESGGWSVRRARHGEGKGVLGRLCAAPPPSTTLKIEYVPLYSG